MEQKKDTDLLRINKKSILFNNKELKAIESYCKKYRINNRSKFMREAIITSILKKYDEDYPTLF
jgi:metal-responsive CopG/Arc/MetJ family transcriptional regulator